MPSSDSASVSLGISRVTDASRAAIEPVAETLALAFNDHITHAINGGYWPELTLARMCGAATTTVLDLECYVAHLPGSTGADAVMLVKPPGIEHGASPNAKGPHTARVDEMVKDRPDLVAAYEQIKNIFHEVEVEAFGPNTNTDMYYISHLATSPSAAGHGLGGKLVEFMVERGKREGVPVTLLTMTERHVKFYERFGLKTKAYMAADLNGTPTEWWAMST